MNCIGEIILVVSKFGKYFIKYRFVVDGNLSEAFDFIVIRDIDDINLNAQLFSHLGLDNDCIDTFEIVEIRKIYLPITEDPTLYVSYENDRFVIAQSACDVYRSIPGRRFRKNKDSSGEYVIIEHIAGRYTTRVKSKRCDWVYV